MSNLLHPTRPASLRRWVQWYPAIAARRSRGRTFYNPAIRPSEVALSVQHSTQQGTGILPLFVAIEPHGNYYTITPNAVLQIINNSGQTVTITVLAQQACNQGYFHNYTLGVASLNVPYILGPLDSHYSDQGKIHIRYSFLTGIVGGVSVAVVAP